MINPPRASMTDPADTYPDDLCLGLRCFQRAFWIALGAVIVHYLMFLIPGIVQRHWEGEFGRYFMVPAILLFSAIAAGGGILWGFGFRVLRHVSWLIHSLLGRRRVEYMAWDRVFCRSLRTLPRLSAIGAVLYLCYFGFGWGGWPEDVIIGIAANLLGAYFYVPLFLGWYRLWRDASHSRNRKDTRHQTGDP